MVDPSHTSRSGPAANSRGPLRVLSGLFFLGCSFGILSLVLTLGISTVPPTLGAPVGTADAEPDFPGLFRAIDKHLEASYLDLDRARPRLLIERALSALELSADEIYVEAPDTESPFVAIHVNDKVRVFALNTLDTREKSVTLLEKVFGFLSRNYNGVEPLIDLRYATANGYLQGLDPHTLVFTPKAFEDFESNIRGEIFGVGMLVGATEDGRLQVRQVLKDTPAYQAGFKRDDLIVKIDDESTINMSITEAVQRIRGERGTEVTLTIKREGPEGQMKTIPVPVRRDAISIKSVESKLIPPELVGGRKVGYIKVINFDQKTVRGFTDNLEKLDQQSENELSALVLDLRGNSGGLLSQAVEMCDVFLEDGDIVITAQKGENFKYQRASRGDSEPEYPVVVLADQSSASGAEIVIGALQKNNRALVVGTSTFGKGSVQQLQRLPNGAQLKITVSEYLLPGKISIQETGVVPDILARGVTLSEDYQNLFPNESVWTERSYEAHIVSRFKRNEEPIYRIPYLDPDSSGTDGEEADDDSPSATELFMSGEIRPEDDPLVQMALKILEFTPEPFDPRKLVQESRGSFEDLKEEFFDGIVERLGELGIDWSLPEDASDSEEPSEPEVEVNTQLRFITEPSSDKDDPVPINQLVVTAAATNRGDRPLYRIKGLSRSEYYLFRDREFLFGKIAPGETIERSVKIRLPYYPHGQNSLLTVEASGPDGKVLASSGAEVELEATRRPAFAYAGRLTDDAGEPIEFLRPDTDARITVAVHNLGEAPVHKGIAILRNKTGRQIFLNKGRIEFSELGVGEIDEVEFRFGVRSGEPVDAYKFELSIIDSYSGELLIHEFLIHPESSKGSPYPSGKLFQPPSITFTVLDPDGPRSDETARPLLVTEGPQVRLEASIQSPDEAISTWVTNLPVTPQHRTPDKIYFDRSEGKARLSFSTMVPLTEGANLVTVVAKDANGIQSRQSMTVRRK